MPIVSAFSVKKDIILTRELWELNVLVRIVADGLEQDEKILRQADQRLNREEYNL